MLNYIYVFIFGTIFASFIHLYVTRTLKGESIIYPGSHCPVCNHKLKWYELIPVLSYIIQRGKCRKCNSKIGKDSLIAEIVTGLLFMVVYFKFGISYESLMGFLIVLLLISICISDFKEMVILDSTLVVGIMGIYLITYLNLGLRGIYKAFLYGVFAFVLMFLIKILGDRAFKRESLGGGDIKLAFLMGSILPYDLFLLSIMISSSTALPYALIATRKKENTEFAFGPFLTIGLFIVFLFQNDILNIVEKIFEV